MKSIPNNGVILMENAWCHNRQTQKVPNRSSNTIKTHEFLLEKDVFFYIGYNKEQLVHLILKIHMFMTTYLIRWDKLFNVVPHCVFNPKEHMWHQVKSHVRVENVSLIYCLNTGNIQCSILLVSKIIILLNTFLKILKCIIFKNEKIYTRKALRQQNCPKNRFTIYSILI